MSTPAIVARTLANAAVYGLLLFVPAGRLDWWRAWTLLALVFAGMLATRLALLRDAGGVLAERGKPPIQPGQPFADKVLVIAFVTVFPAFIAFIPLDVFHLQILHRPPALVSALGLIAFVAGATLVASALRENAFAAAIVTHQRERRHVVVETGVYGYVRHPLYSGVGLVLVGIALWLQSSAAALLAIVPIAVLVARIVVEERFLVDRLAGYATYARRVTYRLVPRIW